MSRGASSAEVSAVLAQVEILRDHHWQQGCDAWLEHDLSLAQLRVVIALQQLGAQPMSRLAESLGIGLPSLSTLADRLEVRGLIVRTRDGADRRVVTVTPTEAGVRLAADVTGMHRDRARGLLEQLTREELGGLRLGLGGLARVLDPAPSAALAVGRPA